MTSWRARAAALVRRPFGRLAYHSVRRSAKVYRRRLTDVIERTPTRDVPVHITLATMTGRRDLAQVCAMLVSFRQYVGVPDRLAIVDDGSLTETDTAGFRTIFPNVEVFPSGPAFSETVAPGLGDYTRKSIWGRKLAGMIHASRTAEVPTLYADSDVLFLPGGAAFATELNAPVTTPWYTSDGNSGALDSRYEMGEHPPVCAGFVVLPPGFEWDGALVAAAPWFAEPEHFTEQTVVHMAVSSAGGRRLDPALHILEYGDYSSLRDLANRPGVVQRHYVSPIRWKFWVRAFGGYGRWLAAVLRPGWLASLRFRR